eukprot:365134_1
MYTQQHSKTIIVGYLCSLNKKITIPVGVIELCLRYLHDMHLFDDLFMEITQLQGTDMNSILSQLQCNDQNDCILASSQVLLSINSYMKTNVLPTESKLYKFAHHCYKHAIKKKSNQSIVFCGKSGSGKTEKAKDLIKYSFYLVTCSKSIRNKIMSISPILEAFGNAMTVSNNNASRFGSAIKLLYNQSERSLIGANLETYFLDQSRVVLQQNNERNYHIPYLLYNGIHKQKHNKFYIQHPSKWHYTNQGNLDSHISDTDDFIRYQQLTEAMRVMNIGEYIQNSLWKILCGLYNLGNVNFVQDENGFCLVSPSSVTYIDMISTLWEIERKSLIKRLQTAKLWFCKSKPIYKKILYHKAAENRDLIAKGLYHRIFLYLCKIINENISIVSNEEQLNSVQWINIIDMPGFDYKNSLEQLCINYANEKLQQMFNYHMIQKQKEYLKQNVKWKPLTFFDNFECIKMIENRKIGFFALLDSHCRAPRPSLQHFIKELNKYHTNNSTLLNSQMINQFDKRKEYIVYGFIRYYAKIFIPLEIKNMVCKYIELERLFIINHYMDTVSYDTCTFLPQNMEIPHPDTAKMFKKSVCDLLKKIYSHRLKHKKSFTGKFHSAFKKLLKSIETSKCRFICCIMSNDMKLSNKFDHNVMKHQLECCNIVQSCTMFKNGYILAISYNELYEKYYTICRNQNPIIRNVGDLKTFNQALLVGFDMIEGEDYEFGTTKMMFKSNKMDIINKILHTGYGALSEIQNTKITNWIVRKRINQLIGVCKLFIKLKSMLN